MPQQKKQKQEEPGFPKQAESRMDEAGAKKPNEKMRGLFKSNKPAQEAPAEIPRENKRPFFEETPLGEKIREGDDATPLKLYASEKLGETTDAADHYMRFAVKMALGAAGKLLSPLSGAIGRERKREG